MFKCYTNERCLYLDRCYMHMRQVPNRSTKLTPSDDYAV